MQGLQKGFSQNFVSRIEIFNFSKVSGARNGWLQPVGSLFLLINNGEFFRSQSPGIVCSGKRLFIQAIEKEPWLLKLIPEKCKAPEICEKAVEKRI